MELLEISWPSHRDYLYDQIYALFNAETGLDFELVLNEQTSADPSPTLRVHSLILKIFCHSLASCDGRQFRLEGEDIKKDDVRCLLEFIYRGRTYVELERLEAVKKAAEKLQLRTFMDLVEGIKIEEEAVNVEVVCCQVEDKSINTNDVENIVVTIVDKDKSDEISAEWNEDLVSKEALNKNADESLMNENSEDSSKCTNLESQKSLEPELNEETEPTGVEDADANRKLEKKEKQLKLLSLENLINSCENYMQQNKGRKVNFACSVCDKHFPNISVFKKHQKSHVELTANKCSHCPYKGRKLALHLALKHQMNVKGELLEQSIKCEQCEYTCATEFLLKSHRKEFHGELSGNARLTCDSCDFTCAVTSELTRHKQAKHSEKIECEICRKKCNRYSIKKHLELHDEVERLKKFKCTLCDNFLSRYRFNLKVHLKKIHDKSEEEIESLVNSAEVRVSGEDLKSKEDPGRIRRCFKGRKKTARRKTVIGEAAKKKVCEICGLVLSSWSTFYRHKRLHREGDSLRRRYQCPECEFRTREKFHLRAHCVKKHEMSFEQFNSVFIKNSKPTENVTVETIQVETEVEIASSIISIN